MESPIPLEALRTQGWQLIKSFVPAPVVAEIREFLAAKVSIVIPRLYRAGVTPGDEVASIGRMLARSDIDRDIAMELVGHLPLADRLDPILQRWVGRAPSVNAILKAALGARSLRMHIPPTARFVLPGNIHAAVPAHQDISYNPHMGPFLTVWTTYSTIDERCGGMAMFDGAGRSAMPFGAKEFWQSSVDTSALTRVVCASMEPGDAILFYPWVVHESMPNHSDRIRFSVDFRFFGEASHSNKHYLDVDSGLVIPPS